MLSFEQFLRTESPVKFVIKTNNDCNLHCEHCTNLCHIPISPTSKYLHRRARWELPFEDLEKFCERFRGIGECNFHLLTGGEVTVMEPSRLECYIDILSHYGRKISLVTNAYGILDVREESILKIEKLIVDSHGINEEQAVKTHLELSRMRGGLETGLERVYHHHNIRKARVHEDNRGNRCGNWMTVFSLFGKVLHPCCNTFWIQAHNNDNCMTKELVEAGWTLDNDDVVETVRNWRQSLPGYVSDQCLYNCWWPNIGVGGKVKITLKASDVREKVAGKGLSKMLSYIVPIKNRAYLFWRNLQSFLHQTSYDFEVVVLDHGSTDNLLEVVGLARSAGIKVRGFRIDVGKCQFMRGDIPHEPPYVAYNVGAKQAEGEVVVLTSPEVINARTNVERIGSLFSDGKSRFALGWIDHAKIEELEKWAGLTVRQIKSLFPEFRKTGAYCREEDFNDHAFFIGAMRRGDYIRIGGMDEEFMDGYLHSGPEFAARCKKAGFEATLFPEVAGIHLEHFRGYQGTGERNRPNWDRWHRWLGRSLANEEREWGMDDYIVDTF